jgi:hypothetical protein
VLTQLWSRDKEMDKPASQLERLAPASTMAYTSGILWPKSQTILVEMVAVTMGLQAGQVQQIQWLQNRLLSMH